MVTFVQSCKYSCPFFWARIQQGKRRRFGLAALLFCSFVLCGCTSKVPTFTSSSVSTTGTLTASTDALAFGSVVMGQTATASVSVTNTGSAAVEISAMAVSGQPFSATSQSSLPTSISAGGTFNFTVQFNPNATGSASGQLTITSNSSSSSSLAVLLSGTGTAATSTETTLSSLSCATDVIMGSTTDSCTVALTGAAGSGGLTVDLSSNNASLTVPATVTVSPGASSASNPDRELRKRCSELPS
jgi:hypothetical protein